MSKKGDGKNGKGNKGGKGNNGDKKEGVAKVVKAKKVKVAGPKPESYKPRAKTAETMQTVEGSYNGYCGLVEVRDMRFRFSTEASETGEKFNVVRFVSAPFLSEFGKVKDFTTSVKLDRLKDSVFVSDYEKGTDQYELQAKIYMFWVKVYMAANLKVVHRKPEPVQKPEDKKASDKQKQEKKTSTSVADFDSRKCGLYCFETSGPKAIISIEKGNPVRAPQFGNGVDSSFVIKLVSVMKGHPLCDCKKGTFLYFGAGLFKGKTPAFKGSSAKDCGMLYTHLANVHSLYRHGVVDKILSPAPASEDAVVGEKVITKPRHHAAQAVA